MLTLRGPDNPFDGPIITLFGDGSDQIESGRIRFREGVSASNWRGAYLHYDGAENLFHIGVHNTTDTIIGNDVNTITINRSDGKVGIGASSPTSLLTLMGPDDPFDGPIITLFGDGSNQIESGRIRFREGVSASNWRGAYLHYDGAENLFHIGVHNTTDTIIGNDVNTITINRSDGKVGIGTSTPGAVVPSTRLAIMDGHVLVENNFGFFSINSTNDGIGAGIDTEIDDNLLLYAGGANRMKVTNTGNVGIGTSSPTSELTVVGTIESTSGGIKFPDGTTQTSAALGSFWALSGNSGTSSSNYLGTSDSQPLRLKTNNTNRLFIDTDGQIGLNTTDPRALLTLRSTDDATNGPILMLMGTGSDQVESGRIRFVEGTSTGNWRGGYIHLDGTANRFHIGVHSASDNNTANDINSISMNRGNGNVGIGTENPSYLLEVNGTAAKPGGGSWTATSDRRLKKDISDYKEGLKKVLAISPVNFRYNKFSGYDTKKEHIGVIAQELLEVAPYMVSTFEKDEEEYLQVDNSAMTYMLINAVKELHQENQNLKAENSQMKNDISQIKTMLEMQAKK